MVDTPTWKIRVSEGSSKFLKVPDGSSPPLKKCWSVGPYILVVIANELVKRFGITEDTYVQQEVTDDGILFRIKHYVKESLDNEGKKEGLGMYPKEDVSFLTDLRKYGFPEFRYYTDNTPEHEDQLYLSGGVTLT